MTDFLTLASTGTSVAVAVLAVLMTFVALRAHERTGNPNLRFVAGAFLLFAAKNLFSGFNVWSHAVPHDAIELVLSVFDLVIIALLVLPLVRRRGNR